MATINVVNSTTNVDWNTNAVLIPCDNIAFSDPHASEPDGKYYVIDREIVSMSLLLKDILEDKAKGEIVEIEMPKINGKTLSVIIMYMNHHHNNRAEKISKPLNKSIYEVISSWDKNFLDNYLLENGNEKKHDVLIDVITAANHLNIEDLTSLTCASIASMIKGKTTEQIRELFDIENDFTPEEEEQIKAETKWCEDTD